MSSTFGTYNIAYTGMYVNQAALTVVSQNLANVDTTGYSRKQISSGDTVVSSAGTGVTLEEVQRARNELLDTTYREQNSTAEYWNNKSGMIDYAQEILDEFDTDDDTGLQTTLENFFDSWDTLSQNPTSDDCRTTVISYAKTLLKDLGDLDDDLQSLQQDACNSAGDIVDEINDIADQVADLNAQIVRAEAGGSEASDLRDQRDTLMDELSGYTDITTQELDSGSVTVYMGGGCLVSGSNTNTLSITGDGSTDNPLTVLWADTKEAATISDGCLKALLEEADQTGFSAINDTDTYDYSSSSVSSITNLRQGLNDLITTIADQINSLHSTGTGVDSNSTTGLDFFVVVDSSQPLSISNMQVNPEIVADDTKLATGTSGDADGTLADEIYDLYSDTDNEILQFAGSSKTIIKFYASLISSVATTGNKASGYYDTQSTVVTAIDNQRQQISSVSLDEEMSNMIRYQNAYGAAARVLSTVDSLVGDMIDQIGSIA